jgi:hypothetical protein
MYSLSAKGRGGDEVVEAETLGLGRRIVPVNIEEFKEWLKSGRSFILVEPELAQKVVRKNMQDALDMAVASLSPWISDANSAMSVSSPEAFKSDLKRKLVGIAETIKSLVDANVSDCIDSIKYIQESKNVEDREKAIQTCLGVIDKGTSAILAMLIAMDGLMSISQANLPLGMMPNMVKGRAGFFTD